MTLPDQKHPVFDHFIGIDVGKSQLVIHDSGTQTTCQIDNTGAAIMTFFKSIETSPSSLVVCEASGGCEMTVLACMVELGIAAHRANAVHIKSFIASYGTLAKTDAGDARAIALYAAERHKTLKLWQPADKTHAQLKALVLRRDDLVAMRVAEKNRARAPGLERRSMQLIARSCRNMVAKLDREISQLEQAISNLVASCETLTRKHNILTAMSGIGAVSAWAILAHMPEIGTCTRRQAASLAGLAPHPKDSGKTRRYRHTRGGRGLIKRALFMPAMTASRHDNKQAEKYKALMANGKSKLVALTAIMRKMIIIANARIRDDAIPELS